MEGSRMKTIVKGRNINITRALKEYLKKKMSKVENHFNRIIKGEAELIVEKNPSIRENQRVEITFFTEGPIFRAVASSKDMYASIDKAINKLERQVEKYKGKNYSSFNKHTKRFVEAALESQKGKKIPRRVVKQKQFLINQMSLKEAILQMELLSHDFFIFANSETGGLNILYRRKDGNYGVIEAILES